MKQIFVFYFIIINIFVNAEYICKNNQTNEEYVLGESHTDEEFTNLLQQLKTKINAQTENSNQQFKLLKDQLILELSEVLETKIKHLNDLLLNISHKLEPETTNLSDNVIKTEPKTKSMPRNCVEATKYTQKSGIYEIQVPTFSLTPFNVVCNDEVQYGGWTVVMRRMDGSVDFDRNWEEYKRGFGNLRGEFFIGLEKLHSITASEPKQELLVLLKSLTDEDKYAKYNSFVIGSEAEGYILKELGKYSGTANDSLIKHVGMKFSTKDVDNDKSNATECAVTYKGGWWFNECFSCHLFGSYQDNNKKAGITWSTISDYNWINHKFAELLIRPVY